jgi:hypothetical protein
MRTPQIYAIVALVVAIAQSCSSPQVEYDWKKDKLKDKVKSYTEYSYKAEERFEI